MCKKGLKVMYLELGLDGFIYQCSDGTYYIVINNQLNLEQQCMLKETAIAKIRRGDCKGNYLIFI